MDWRAVKFDWNRVRAFLVTAQEGSLSSAARALGMNQPTLSRQVGALEEELGVALFERSGRGLTLTPAGLDLIDHAEKMGAAAARLSLAAYGQSQALEGPVGLTATEYTAAYLLPPIIARLREMHPGITIELTASETASDLRRREADIAIRAFRPTQPDLVAARICSSPAGFYAAPAYLDRQGRPASPGDMARLDFIGLGEAGGYRAFLNAFGFDLSEANFPVSSSRLRVHVDLALSGLGVILLPDHVGRSEPRLERLLPDLPPVDGELWLVSHSDLKTNRRIRIVFDFLKKEIATAVAGQ